MDCQICCEKYTAKIRKKYSCIHCNQNICSKCLIKHIQNNIQTKSIFGPYGLTKITCLFCKLTLNPSILRDLLSKNNYNKIIKEELDQLFNDECNLLNDTEKIIEEHRIIYEINTIRKWMALDGFNEESISNTLQDMGYVLKKDEAVVQTVRSCPDCNNFMLNYKCTSCSTELCSKCLLIKNNNHLCDNKTVETIKKVNETCRNCPNCKLLIEKEEGGCDQMFCIECHTTFSWTTGKIAEINHVRHNPHFFEWRRKNNTNIEQERQPNDNPCEGPFLIKCEEIEHGDFLKIINTVFQKTIEDIDEIYERDDFIREQFRIKFLTKKLTLSQWKKKFTQHINTQRYNKETKNIIELCLHSLYYIILFENGNNEMIQTLFRFITENMQHLQQYYKHTIRYVLIPLFEN